MSCCACIDVVRLCIYCRMTPLQSAVYMPCTFGLSAFLTAHGNRLCQKGYKHVVNFYRVLPLGSHITECFRPFVFRSVPFRSINSEGKVIGTSITFEIFPVVPVTDSNNVSGQCFVVYRSFESAFSSAGLFYAEGDIVLQCLSVHSMPAVLGTI